MRDYSLIAFTILSQAAVGAFWALLAADLHLALRHGAAPTSSMAPAPLLVILAIMSSSLLVALTHLGSPSIAYRAVANLRSSRLSREVLFANLFAAACGAFTGLQWMEIGSPPVRAAVAWLAAILGALLIHSMSRLYMLRSVPIWNSIFTPLSFLLTSLVLGGLTMGAVLSAGRAGWYASRGALDVEVLVMITAGALLFLGGELILVPARIARLLSGSVRERQALQGLFERHGSVFYYRLLLGIGGATCLVFMLWQSRYDPGLYASCLALVSMAELFDRFLFYSAREVSRI